MRSVVGASLAIVPSLRKQVDELKPSLVMYDAQCLWGYLLSLCYSSPTYLCGMTARPGLDVMMTGGAEEELVHFAESHYDTVLSPDLYENFMSSGNILYC